MKKSNLTVHLSGGLGNQLFQFMAGVGLAEVTNRSLAINTNLYKNPTIINRHHSAYQKKRRLEIADFRDVALTARDRSLTPRDGRYERILINLSEETKRSFGVASEESFSGGKWARPEEIRRLVGHFMSPKFFLNSEVRQRFQDLVTSPSFWLSEMSKKIKLQESIGVHIRLGDYLHQRNIIVPEEIYFLNAINHIKKLAGGTVKPFLFTDDPQQLARKFPKLFALAECVNPPSTVKAAENLVLLSKCSWFICSNSTFSWWGATISSVSSSMVVRPSKFYAVDLEGEASLGLWNINSTQIHPITGEVVNGDNSIC